MKLLVTGGAGFIGSHVVQNALNAGHDVAVLDDFSAGSRDSVPLGVRLFEVDLRNRERIIGALGAYGPTHVSHHAAWIDAPGSSENPRAHLENNVMGSLNLIEACHQVGVERVVFASSGGAIYGEVGAGQWATEETIPCPENPYGVGKLAVEHLLASQFIRHGFPSAMSLRYPNVYGPRQLSGVVGIFMRAALRGEEIKVLNQYCERTYAYVEDVAKANLLALEAPAGYPTLNVPGIPATTARIADEIRAATGSSSPIRYCAARPGDVVRSVIQGAEFFGMFRVNVTPLSVGIQRTLEWWRGKA